MAWKSEQWLRDVFPGRENIYSEYRSLPRRELAIVAGAVLDSALAELLVCRLAEPKDEVVEFLGLNGDGRAPCGSFGARIQLARFTGILTTSDSKILRLIKNIRNRFAHEVRADFTTALVLPLIFTLHDEFLTESNRLVESGRLLGPKLAPDFIRPHLATEPEAGAGLLLAVFATYQAYFHSIIEHIQPLSRELWPVRGKMEQTYSLPAT